MAPDFLVLPWFQRSACPLVLGICGMAVWRPAACRTLEQENRNPRRRRSVEIGSENCASGLWLSIGSGV